ncbi:MAG: YkgJ family cysteine cluster protein [Sulfuritalea sp.]|nr:YkgJ family cysteine cluster protein [Sulfuritalea sp.]
MAGDNSDEKSAISCSNCSACCCQLEVMLMGDDDIPAKLSIEDRWGGSVMRRLDDGWCIAVNRDTMKCSIYEIRPEVCREYQVGDNDCIIERTRHFVDGGGSGVHPQWPIKLQAT